MLGVRINIQWTPCTQRDDCPTRPSRMDTDGTTVRMTVAQAARTLGISAEAVRQRVRRGTLPTEKSEDGSVFVLIDPLQYAERTRTDGVGTGDGTSDEALLSAHLDH